MGKAQSKRSVDITTDVKKDDVLEEGTGKMGKIEDVDQLKPQVNGDTHHNETEGIEKDKTGDAEATENEKDLSTEKEQSSKSQIEGAGEGDIAAAAAETTTAAASSPSSETTNKAVENGNDEVLNESKTSEATSTVTNVETTPALAATNGDSNKKTKKEKLKKKWSFRSISFGKKDKQKPPKKDEENAAINGECEKVPEENTEETAQNKNAEQSPNESVKPAAEAVEEKKETTAVNGTESPAEDVTANKEAPPAVDAAAAVAKSSETVPPVLTENAAEVKDEKTTDKTVPAESTTEAPANLKGVADTVTTPPAKIEEQIIPAPPAPVEDAAEPKEQAVQPEIATPSTEEKPKEEAAPAPAAEAPQNPSVEEKSAEIVATEEAKPAAVEEQQPQSEVSAPVLVEKEVQEEQKPELIPVEEAPVVAKTEEKVESAVPAESTTEVPAPAEPSPVSPVVEEVKSAQDPTKEETVVEKPVREVATETTNESPKSPEAVVSTKSEGEINPEQIAQTIALIDEVTQEVLATTEQKLDSNEQSISEGGEVKVVEQKDVPVPALETVDEKQQQPSQTEPCNASPPEGNTSEPKDPELISSATTDSPQIPPATSSPVVKLGSEQKVEGEATTVAAETEKTTDTPAEPNGIVTEGPEETEVIKVTEIQPEQQAEAPTQELSTENKENIPKTEIDAENTIKEAVAADALETVTSKENGIGGEHHETSATESLNGQVEPKTAEEIKSEQKTSDVKVDGNPEVPVAVAE